MKTTNDYITILRKYLSTKADAYGITKIGIFGSVARNEQTEDSDVDVCVEMKKPDLFTMVHIKEELQELFGKPVDIVRLRNNMNPMLLKQIKRDGIYAWRRTNHHYFDIDESIVLDVVKNKLSGMLKTINKMIEEYKKHRSSKEQANMVLPSLDRLSYIHCLLKEFLPNYKRRFLCKSSLICLSCSNIWSNFAPDFGW